MIDIITLFSLFSLIERGILWKCRGEPIQGGSWWSSQHRIFEEFGQKSSQNMIFEEFGQNPRKIGYLKSLYQKSLQNRIFEEFGQKSSQNRIFEEFWKFLIFVKIGFRADESQKLLPLIHTNIKFYSKIQNRNKYHHHKKCVKPENQPVDDVEQYKSWREKHSWDTVLVMMMMIVTMHIAPWWWWWRRWLRTMHIARSLRFFIISFASFIRLVGGRGRRGGMLGKSHLMSTLSSLKSQSHHNCSHRGFMILLSPHLFRLFGSRPSMWRKSRLTA